MEQATKQKVRQVVVHNASEEGQLALAERVSEYHAVVIERRLHESGLSIDTQIEVINGIITRMRERERGKTDNK